MSENVFTPIMGGSGGGGGKRGATYRRSRAGSPGRFVPRG